SGSDMPPVKTYRPAGAVVVGYNVVSGWIAKLIGKNHSLKVKVPTTINDDIKPTLDYRHTLDCATTYPSTPGRLCLVGTILPIDLVEVQRVRITIRQSDNRISSGVTRKTDNLTRDIPRDMLGRIGCCIR